MDYLIVNFVPLIPVSICGWLGFLFYYISFINFRIIKRKFQIINGIWAFLLIYILAVFQVLAVTDKVESDGPSLLHQIYLLGFVTSLPVILVSLVVNGFRKDK